MDQQAQINFFFDANNKLDALKKNVAIWKKSDKKKVQFVDEIIQSEEQEIDILQKYVEDVKVYIIIMGTISAGKSTFINSILGSQLLPQKNQECTKQFMEITYGEQLKINDQIYNNLEEARQLLTQFQQNQEFFKVKIEFPSLFHQELPHDLRKKVVFIDTPGVEIKNIESKHYESLDDIVGKHHVIKVWISNYTCFDSEKKEIFSFLSTQKIEYNQQNLADLDLDGPEFFKKEIEQKECIDKLLFLLNKYDMRDESEDDPIEPIIKTICQKIGDENFIYKISSTEALEYRVMTFGDQLSKDLFVSKFFIAHQKKKKFKNKEQCRKFCVEEFEQKTQLVDDQDYPILIHQLKQQIQLKIHNQFYGARLTKILSLDFYLQMILQHDLKTTVKQTDDLKAGIVGFISTIHDLLTQYEEDIRKLNQDQKGKIDNIINMTKKSLSDLNFFKKIFSGNYSTLQQLCTDVLKEEQKIRESIRLLNKKYQEIILQKIKSVEDQNGKIQELSQTCQRLFDQFSDKQSKYIEITSFQKLQDSFYNILGVELSTPWQTRIGMLSSVLSGGVFAVETSLAVCAATTIITPVAMAATSVLSAGMLLIVVKKFVLENKFHSVQDVAQKLKLFQEIQCQMIDDVCQNYVKNNNQTIKCLKSLFMALVQ